VLNAPLADAGDLAVLPQLARDCLERGFVGDAIDGLSQCVARTQRGRQLAIVLVPDFDAGSVQGHEPTAAGIDVHRPKPVVGEELAAGLDIVDTEHQGIGAKDLHAFVSQRYLRRLPHPGSLL
jgi:hypothetical protein